MNKMHVFEMRDDYDWSEAMAVASAPYGVEGYSGPLDFAGWDDLAECVACDEGENDGASWIAAFRMLDGRYLWLSASCDYTGWECQSGGFTQIASNMEDLVRFAMGDEDRRRLGFTLA